jgi:hypothetical protein
MIGNEWKINLKQAEESMFLCLFGMQIDFLLYGLLSFLKPQSNLCGFFVFGKLEWRGFVETVCYS